MNLIFSNPWGFLALLGIPLLVLIYYLRRRAKVVTVSTLFLLKRTQRESRAGRRFESFSNSLPFWLQVLAVLLLTWILVGPKYGNHRVTQQIAIVVDSSASMQPLREGMEEKLRSALGKMKGSADHASYIVMDHDPRAPRIYQGDEVEALIARMAEWNPRDGALDPTASLRIARSLVGPGGVVVYLTDHDGEALPLSCHRLALGEARANCGFTGVTVERKGEGFVWTAMMRNYGDAPQTREWALETLDGRRTEPKKVTLPPRKLMSITGEFPAEFQKCVLRLSGDAMPLDDVLPMVVKEPQEARLRVLGNEEVKSLGERMVRGFAHVVGAAGDESELVMRSVASGEEVGAEKPTIVFYDEVEGERPSGKWLSEENELTKGLNFQALTVRALEEVKARKDDRVLLWLDQKPVILLRRDPVSLAEQLTFTFSLAGSNAGKLPAVAVLLHRFSEVVARETLTAHTSEFETGQLLAEEFAEEVAREDFQLTVTSLGGEMSEVALSEGFRVTQRVPKEPSFVSLKVKGEPYLEGAVMFADTREANLSQAATTELPEIESELIERRVSDDRWWRVIVVLLLGLILAAWYFLTPREKSS